MQIRTIRECDMDAATDGAIRRGLCECFPADAGAFGVSRAWHGSAPFLSFVLTDGSELIAHAGLVDRWIRVGERGLRVAGVQNVFVRPAFRGRGYAEQVMRGCMASLDREVFDFGLLFCTVNLEGLYNRCGWRFLGERTVIRTDGSGGDCAIPDKNTTMYYCLGKTDFPEGVIHLCGNDW